MLPKHAHDHAVGDRRNKRNADQLGMEVIGMLWEVGVGRFCESVADEIRLARTGGGWPMLQGIVTGCASLGGPPELDAFRKHLPREWIEEALRATGTATLRRRRLPAEQVVWLVLGMALFKDRSITDVVNKLDLALPGSGKVTVAPSAISQARARLGQEPVRWLFEQCANKWAHQSGTCQRV